MHLLTPYAPILTGLDKTMNLQDHRTRTIAAAAACLVLILLLYHIPTQPTVAGDALHAVLAGFAALACLAWARPQERPDAQAFPAAAAGACLLAAAASAAVPIALGGVALSFATADVASMLVLACSCLGTALWEEALFRRFGLDVVRILLGDDPRGMLKATLATSALFAAAHLGGSIDPASVLRFVQVALFGIFMCGVVARRRGFVWAVGLHAAYDLVCFAPGLLAVGGQGAPQAWLVGVDALMQLETSLPGMVASMVFLVPAAVWAIKSMPKD